MCMGLWEGCGRAGEGWGGLGRAKCVCEGWRGLGEGLGRGLKNGT